VCIHNCHFLFVQQTKASKVSERSRRRGVVEEKHAITHENVLLRCAKKWNLGHKFESGMEKKNKATRKLMYKIKQDKMQ